MNYQLVIQFKVETIEDFDTLILIEDELEEKLDGVACVDGHDIGSSEMNIFVLTSTPLETFRLIKDILTHFDDNLVNEMKVAYRNLQEDIYQTLWPNNLAEFSII